MTEPWWRFRILVESGAEPDLELVSAPASASPGAVAEALAELFAREPELSRVNLAIGDEILGVTSRDLLTELRQLSAARDFSGHDPGAGDGATLPGLSTGYVVLRFRCPSCAEERRLLFVDDAPACPRGHGAMERFG